MSLTDMPSIAFSGKAGAGKSTAAAFLAEAGWAKVSIATPLKRIAVELIGEGADRNRGFLQDLGQLVRREDVDAWVKLALEQMNRLREIQRVDRFTVDDMRFPNEYWMLKGHGFVVVRIEADRDRRIDRLRAIGKLQDEAQLDDESETALDDHRFDYTLDGNGTPDELADQVRDVVFRERKRL